MTASFKLFASTPSKVLFNGEVVSLSLTGGYGQMEILPDHAAIISLVQKGKVTVRSKEHQITEFEALSGFFEMKENEATLLLN